MRSGQRLPSDTKAFFTVLEGNLNIPGGVDVQVVEYEAQNAPARMKLFRSLGVLDLTQAKTYTLTLDAHRRHGSAYDSGTVQDVIDHAQFLVTATGKPTDAGQHTVGCGIWQIVHSCAWTLFQGVAHDKTIVPCQTSDGRFHAGMDRLVTECYRYPFNTETCQGDGVSPEFWWIIDNSPKTARYLF